MNNINFMRDSTYQPPSKTLAYADAFCWVVAGLVEGLVYWTYCS